MHRRARCRGTSRAPIACRGAVSLRPFDTRVPRFGCDPTMVRLRSKAAGAHRSCTRGNPHASETPRQRLDLPRRMQSNAGALNRWTRMVLLAMVAILAPVVIAWLLLRWLIRLVRPGAETVGAGSAEGQRRLARVRRFSRGRARRAPGESPCTADAPVASKSLRRLDARVPRLRTSR